MLWWSVYLVVLSLVMVVVWWRQGPRRALAAGMLLVLLVPEWVRYYPLGPPPDGRFNDASVWINLRVALSVVGACLYLLHPKSTYNFKLVWTDWAVLGMMVTHLVSDTLADGFHWAIPFRIYGEWYLPYILGRVAIQSIGDARWALPFAVGVTLVLACFSLAESVLKLSPNPSEMLLVDVSEGIPIATVRPEDGTPRESDRIGFKRAYGPTMHPIYFGTLQLLLLPWMVYAASRSLRAKSTPSWWAAMPLICILGICGPVSRAPLMAVGIMFYVMFMILRPQSRRTMGLAAAAIALVLAVDMLSGVDFVLGGLERITGEDQYQKEVVIDGRKIKYTGTRHRFLLFDEYGYALRNAGLFGWGTERLSSFPPNVPRASAKPPEPQDVLEATPQAPLTIDIMSGKKLRPSQMPRPQTGPVLPSATRLAEVETLDNSYLLFTLRFGYIGLIFFTAITATAAWNYVRLALLPEAEGKMWLTAMAGTVVGMAFVLFTVWMPQDFGYFYLFLCGASAGLLAEKENPKLPPEQAHTKHRRRRRRSRRHRDDAGDESSQNDSAEVSAGDPAVEETPS